MLGLSAASGLLAAGALALLVLSWDAPVPDAWGFRGYSIMHALAFTTVGAFIALRRRTNPVGWLLLSAGVVTAIEAFALGYAEFTIVGRHAEWPFGALAGWIGSWVWGLVVNLILPILLLRFPDGRPLSVRWRAVEWLAALTTIDLVAFFALTPGPLQLARYVENPYAIASPVLIDWLLALSTLGFVCTGAAAWSVVVRFRRSAGIERQQLKWLALSALPLVTTGLASAVLSDKSGQVLFVFMQMLIPIAIGIAVLRYRLYDVDILIHRTLVYGTLSASLIATYAATVILVGAALRPFTIGSELAVAVSTLATLALVQPLRRRIQESVDRRFYRARYDAVRTLDAFSVRLRDEVDLDAVRGELVAAARDTMQPAHASVWLR